MKVMAAFVLLSCSCCAFGQDKAAISAAEAACGPSDVGFKVTADDSRHPTPSPESGKAAIYVVQRAGGVMKFGADGKWLGASKNGSYFFAFIDPGEHHLCVTSHLPLWKGLWLHELNAKAGETYYFFVHVVAGGGHNVLTLTHLDADEGKELVARSKFNASHPK